MYKIKTTARDLRAHAWAVIGVGYCDIQNIERYLEAKAYTCGVYGWNSDVYQMPGTHNILISTGYRPTHFAYNERARRTAGIIAEDLRRYDKRLGKKQPAGKTWDAQRRRVESVLAKIASQAYDATSDMEAES